MSVTKPDELVAALVAHRILEGTPIEEGGVGEAGASADEDERRLDALMGLYAASNPSTPSGAPRSASKAKLWRRIGWASLSLAAAAAVVLVLRGRPDEPAPLGTRYELELLQGLEEFRGDDGTHGEPKMRAYREDRPLELWLRPVLAVDGPVEVVAYARRPGETLRLSIEPAVRENGAVHVEATTRDMGLEEGEWELVFVVGRAGQLPVSFDEVEAPAPAEAPYDVQTVDVRVVAADHSGGRGGP